MTLYTVESFTMKKNRINHIVTVIIPVYDDWTTLGRCIESLKKHLDKRHKVLLVNDMGPNWNDLEKNILASIKGFNNFVYEKNPVNSGFVKTCNRAVFELDKTGNDILLLNSDTEVTENFLEEMLDVLYITEKHGAVCPRSNCATIFTIPVNKDSSVEPSPEQSYSVYGKVRDLLPRYNVMPTGVGFALLIKRRLIDTYGLFDELYSPGYNEENDFCMRINQYGYNVIAANRAFVFHYESKSFGTKRTELDLKHSKYLLERYPYYPKTVRLYQNSQIDPVEYFADIIGGLYSKKRVLIDLYEVPSAYNGTAQYGLCFLNSFYKLYKDKYDISILANEAADKFHKISEHYDNVYYPHTINGRFDIAYTPSQIIHVDHWHVLNRVCLKYVFCMQDIISLRSNYILAEDWERRDIFEQSIKYSDGIAFISRFSEEETRTYYNRVFGEREIRTKVIYHGRFYDKDKKHDSQKLPFDEYIVVIGNHYKHKNLSNVIPELKKSKYNFIVIGNKYTGKVTENIYGYQTGNLSDEFLRLLYRNSSAILFPSVYEGFGLPFLTAIDYGKSIVVNDNELNNELIEAFDKKKEYAFKFKYVEEIEKCLDEAVSNIINSTPDEICDRKWDDVAKEVAEMLEEVMAEDVDVNKLYNRFSCLRYESNVHRFYLPNSTCSNYKEIIKRRLARFPHVYNFLKRIKHILKGE